MELSYSLEEKEKDLKTRSRGWVFTINNYTEDDEAFCGELFWVNKAKYVVVGKEVAPTTLTPHLQGYVYFHNQIRFSTLKEWHPTAYWFKARGNPDQNHKYCTKAGDYLELGEKPLTYSESGKKSAKERWELAKAGEFEELDPEHIKVYEYIHAKFHDVDDNPIMQNYWFCGPSGCGKSSKVRNDYTDFYIKGMNKWWDGYKHEEVVLLDDFDPSHGWLAYHLKIWGDHYKFPAEVKGGSMVIRPKIVIVTSQYTIAQCFRHADGSPNEEAIDAMHRRFQELKYSGFFGQFVDNNYVGNPTYAPNFVLPPPTMCNPNTNENDPTMDDLTAEEIEELLKL